MGAVYHPTRSTRIDRRADQEVKATLLISTPTFFASLYRACAPGDLATLRHVVVAPSAAPDFASSSREVRLRSWEGYGATEWGPWSAVNVPDVLEGADKQVGTKPGTVGHPIPGVAAKVVDPETGAEKQEGEEACCC